jgi:phenylacetate-coenzyme A ligase PaaK-like adenylate-forming protein
MNKNKSEFDKRAEKLKPSKESWDPIDKALYEPKNFFSDYKKNQDLLTKAIAYSYKNHFKNNNIYGKLCEFNNLKPDLIKSKDDYNKIPLLPDSFFKDYPEGVDFLKWLENIYSGSFPTPQIKSEDFDYDVVIDDLDKKDISIMFTSGTSGRFSFIPRDKTSWNRLKYNAMKIFTEIMDYNPDDIIILLIPDPKLTNLTIASLFGIAYDLYKPENIHVALKDLKITIQFLRMQINKTIGIKEKIKAKALSKFTPLVQKKSDKRIINLLQKFEKEGKRVLIGGPPFWLNRIIERMEKENIKLNLSEGQILTGGGWKSDENKRIPEEKFREKIQNILGIPQNRFHDIYAMSECSSVFLSCEGHYKHVPPTIVPIILDEELKPIGYGKYGRFAFIDPLPKTYPGFIVTGDKVKLLEKCPKCNHEGPVLDIEVSRMPGSEGRGCAAVMADLMSQE